MTICKSIAIILMVVGHTDCPAWLVRVIYSFHMPLFFFVSGYCYKDRYIDKPILFVFSKVRSLYIPFCKYALFVLFIHNFLCDMHFYDYMRDGHYNLLRFLKRFCLVVFFMNGEDGLIGGFWFLRCLFWGALVSSLVIRIFQKELWTGLFFMLCLATCAKKLDIIIPLYNIRDWMFVAALFHYSGFFYQKIEKDFNVGQVVKWTMILVCMFFLTVLSQWYPSTAINASVSLFLPCLIKTYIGIFVCWNIADFLSKHEFRLKKYIEYVGRNTLIILAWHFISFKLVSLAAVSFCGLPISHLGYFPFIPNLGGCWWLFYSLIGVLIPISSILVVGRLKKRLYLAFSKI